MGDDTTLGAPNAAALPSATVPTGGPAFPVVGLGASAGGLDALHAFFAATPPDTGMAFVVILHLSPDYASQAASLIQQHTPMLVQQVTDGARLRPNQVYVIPPAQQVVMVDGQLRLVAPQTAQGQPAPIDQFFRTLADTHDGHAVAVILSGTGSDGTMGSTRIKERGGAVFVQDPEEAAFAGMPRSAIATGLVDAVLPVADIPARLASYWRPATPSGAGGDGAALDADSAVLADILAVLRVRTNHDFREYKRPTVVRRIGRRMQVVGVPDLATYLGVLRSQPEEVAALLGDLLISVTNFFRDPAVWSALEAIIPQVFAGKSSGDQVRVWVPACATGEEAYSVAILLLDYALTLQHPPAIQIFATDIHEQAIAQARRATYLETIAGDVSPERLRRFFVLEQGRYRVKQEVRELVMFATHNVLRDPPFTRLDLVTCRNLLIYLTRTAQEHVFQIFQFSLRPGGYLLLGTAEALDSAPDTFVTVAKAQHLYRRASRPSPPPPLPLTATRPALARVPEPQAAPDAVPNAVADLHQRLLLAHTPPSALVTADYEIVHLTRGTSRFLALEGAPSVNLLRLAHPDLRLELQTALFQAGHQGQRVERRGVRVAIDETVRSIDLVVEPAADAGVPEGYLLVLFADGGPADTLPPRTPSTDEGMRDLHTDLTRTKEQLQITIEQFATSSEEYKAANEELQAINEELRAASEELETSKEELQAVNEELSTVNQQLKHTVDELTGANNDLQNLIAATHIATLFLDRELRIMRYTPTAEAIFNLIPTDLNRPLQHVTHSLRYDQFDTDAAQVLRTLVPIEQEVASAAGQWYLVQLRPYRTTDDRIAGVVMSFVDITTRKRAEDALRESEQRLRVLIENFPGGAAFIVDRDLRYQVAQGEALYTTGLKPEDLVGKTIFEALPPTLAADYETFYRHGLAGEPFVVEHTAHGFSYISRGTPLRSATGEVYAVLAVSYDITERNRAEAALRESEERFHAVADLVPDLLWSTDPGGAATWYNQRWLDYTGQTLDEARAAGWLNVIHPDDRDRSLRTFQTAVDRGEPFRQTHRICAMDGRYRWFLVQAQPVRDAQGQISGWYGAATDIHDQRLALADAEAALNTRDQFLSIASHELRTPLTALLGYAHLLPLAITQGRGEPLKMTTLITRQAQRLNTLIEQLLDVSRLQQGQFVIAQQSVDLVGVVAQVVDEFRAALPQDTPHLVTLEGPNAPVMVLGDAERLEQVMLNLLSNAVKYSPNGGPVRVHLTTTATEAVITVADQGIGIPADAQARLFEAFYRAATTGPQISGFGLGLHIVHEIVARHGGRIAVESVEGQGSTFRVVLPRPDSAT